jgi:hypothetical protein
VRPPSGREAGDRPARIEREVERRRRRARVFGDVLPEQTRDDQSSDQSPADRSPDGSSDEWLRSQVPPHHG